MISSLRRPTPTPSACGTRRPAPSILAAELAALAPDAVAAELDEAGRLADAAAERHDEVGEHLRDLAAQLKVYGSEGRKGRLDAAEAEREHAQTEHDAAAASRGCRGPACGR